jgi:acyl-coenzyme A thioesterase PaaI-like protein
VGSGRILLPWSKSCFVCGEANPRGLRAKLYQVGARVEMSFVAPRELVGWSDVVHGGLLGTVMDEVMAWAAIVDGRCGYFAAECSVRFQKPLPVGHPCWVRAEVIGTRRQLKETAAWIEDDAGVAYARGRGRYLPLPRGQIEAFRHDFVWAEGCLDLREALGLDSSQT